MAPVVTWLPAAAALVAAGDEAAEGLVSVLEPPAGSLLPVGTAALGGLFMAQEELGLTRALDETRTDELGVGRTEGVCECECECDDDGVGVGVGVVLVWALTMVMVVVEVA